MPTDLTVATLPVDSEPTPTVALSAVADASENEDESAHRDDTHDAYDGIDWTRLP